MPRSCAPTSRVMQSAFGELVRRHRDRLWAVALRTLGDREEAADAVQDALVSAFRAADRFRGDPPSPPGCTASWSMPASTAPADGRADRPSPCPSSRQPTVAQPPPDSDTALTVRAALAQLPAEQRVPLILLDMQGYSVAEIAAILGVAEGTVKSRCARGRARLAVMLRHLRGETDHDRPGRRNPAPQGRRRTEATLDWGTSDWGTV